MYHGTTKKAEGAGGGIYPVSEGAWASEHTVDSCLAALRLFFRLYGEISAENLDAFRRYLMEHYKISTVNSRIYGIKPLSGLLF